MTALSDQPNTANIIATPRAIERVKEILTTEKPNSRLRITVEGGGCSGFKYDYSFDDRFNQDDTIIADVVIIDSTSLSTIDGTLDYIETLGYAGFEITNKNAKMKCGCGNSFSL